ncbi:MauE/DoxX family redox-associated membrane protein [Streptomyces caeni]|uniref:MauE/DoxX family redox-associated membrane protein n=1 Tax=Streptomyces caeni TaxID=2307231 RepID=A0ABW4J247_9ACTN
MILRLVLGIACTAMAAGQLASWPDMPRILAAYRVGGHVSMTVLAAVLIVGELAAGLWFLTAPRSRRRAPVWIYTGVSMLWAALAAQAFARALTVPVCGCFGRYLPQRLSWIVLAEDALLLLYAALLLGSSRPTPAHLLPVPTDAEGVHPR